MTAKFSEGYFGALGFAVHQYLRAKRDEEVSCAGLQVESLLKVYSQLGLLDNLPLAEKSELEQILAAYQLD